MPNQFLPERMLTRSQTARMPFGPYAGSTIASLPDWYLSKLLDDEDKLTRYNVLDLVRAEWKSRGPKR